MRTRYCLVALVGLGLAIGVNGDEKKDAKAEPLTDATFVQKAADGGMTEVQAGKIAEARAMNPEVKKFGARMVADHTKANDELVAIAKELRLSIPQKISPKHEKVIAELSDEKLTTFDKEYMRHMVEGHEDMVNLLTQASKDVKNEQLRGFAAKTLPVVKEHLELAKKLHAQVEKNGK